MSYGYVDDEDEGMFLGWDLGAPTYRCQCGTVVREGRQCEECPDEGGEG